MISGVCVRVLKRSLLGALTLMVLASCGTAWGNSSFKPASSSVLWPAPKNPIALTRKAGLVPEKFEHLRYHVHAHLDVFLNGASIIVPAGLGINIHDPGVKHGNGPGGPEYGGIKMCNRPCISPLHTHDTSGVLHTESATKTPNHLGQLFIEWGVRLNAHCVGSYCSPHTKIAIYVNGKRYGADPTKIRLANRTEIAVVVGKPPDQIPSSSGI